MKKNDTGKITGRDPGASKSAKRRWFIPVGGAAVVLIVLGMLMASGRKAGSSAQSENLRTFTVRRDDLPITVTESGNIKAQKSIDLKSEVEGRATIISIVPEGSYVTAEDVNNGKILCELDSGDLDEQLAQREIDFASTEASYKEATEAYDIRVKQNESDVTAAMLKVKFALIDFKKYLGAEIAGELVRGANDVSDASGPTTGVVDVSSLLSDPNNLGGEASQKHRELTDQIRLAELNRARAEFKLEGTQELFDANYVAELELKGDELEMERFGVQKTQADTALQLWMLYEFPKQTEKLLSDYYEAGRELDRTQARARSKLAQAFAQKKSAEARFNLRKNRLAKTKAQIKACTIKAPAPGLVVYGSSGDQYRRYRGASIIAAGETVYQRQTIIQLPDTSEMMAEINVHESSVDKVQPDQRAKIIMDAFPDETFQGEVLKVAPLPDQQRGWLSPDVKVYTTQVSIEGTHDFLKPGMSAKVEVLVDHLKDVLIVPVQVVANRGGKKVCYVTASQKSTERQVKTGAFNDTYVQILEGLQPGERVLMNPPRITEVISGTEEQSQPQGEENENQQPASPARMQNETGSDKKIERHREMQNGEPNEETKKRMEQFRQMMKDGKLDEATKKKMEQFRKNRRDGQQERPPGGADGQGRAGPQRQGPRK